MTRHHCGAAAPQRGRSPRHRLLVGRRRRPDRWACAFDFEGREDSPSTCMTPRGLSIGTAAAVARGFSGRGGEIVSRRAAELGVHDVILGRVDKANAFDEFLERNQLEPSQVAYVGDDLNLPVLKQVGFAATVPEARPEVLQQAQFVTRRSGGFGAARDVIEVLLKARGVWQSIVAKAGRP